MTTFGGALTALVTPFRGGEVDYRAIRELVEEQVQGGIDGLVPCGTTGESVNLSKEEYAGVIRTAVQTAKGRVPVIAGAGTASTHHTLELCAAAHEAGADGVMVVVPYYNRPSQEGLYHHYKTVAQQSALPVVIYNIPVRTGSDLNTATLARLAEIKQIVGIKEATGNVLRSQEIAATFGERFTILSGDDALTLAVMAVGGHGVISTTSNLAPKPVAHVVDRFRAGDLAGARALQQKLLPLYRAMFVEGNPGPVKAALAMRGKIAPELRLPMVWPAEASLEQIRRAIDETEVEL